MLHFRYFTFLLACLLCPIAATAVQVEPVGSKITIGGSGGTLATMQILADAFKKNQSNVDVKIVPSLSSGGGMRALLAGAIDIAVLSRPVQESERTQAVIDTPYARTPLVFATATHMNVSNISTSQLVSIYTGNLKKWPDDRPIRIVLRPEIDSDTLLIKSWSPAMNDAVKLAEGRQGMIMALTDLIAANSLESIPGALGPTTLAQIISEQRALRPLALDGNTPSLKSMVDRTYPHYKTFRMVSLPKVNPLALQFVAFVRSNEGQQILEKNGQLSLPRN